jgi:hypothetical protein
VIRNFTEEAKIHEKRRLAESIGVIVFIKQTLLDVKLYFSVLQENRTRMD